MKLPRGVRLVPLAVSQVRIELTASHRRLQERSDGMEARTVMRWAERYVKRRHLFVVDQPYMEVDLDRYFLEGCRVFRLTFQVRER